MHCFVLILSTKILRTKFFCFFNSKKFWEKLFPGVGEKLARNRRQKIKNRRQKIKKKIKFIMVLHIVPYPVRHRDLWQQENSHEIKLFAGRERAE